MYFYNYDCNGTKLTRVENGMSYTQGWNQENRLQTVTVNGATTTFTYDGDGKLVKKTVGITTTYYVGPHYEKLVSTNVVTATKYYYFGSQRVGMRVCTGTNGSCGTNGATSTLTYLHADHLGSASLSTNASGGKTAEMRYYPYGERRSGGIFTDRRYTGQREEAGLGLYDYNARYYDPVLGRFIQADTIVPSPANPQSLNRYSYVLNSPLRYTDPSGHYTPEEIRKYLQENYKDWQSYWDAWQADPYWMWILGEAKDNYVLEIVATGITIQFRHKAGSFVLSEGKLHEYQGQGAYALYDENKKLVEDKSWLGYGSETGTFGRIWDGKWRRSYFQPMYDYSGGKPVFTQWRYVMVGYGKPDWRFLAGDNVPLAITLGYKAGEKGGVFPESPEAEKIFAAWSLLTAIDNLTVNTANVVIDQYVDWILPPSGPHPASTTLQNPNGIGYPAP